jgi:hypothetical protein
VTALLAHRARFFSSALPVLLTACSERDIAAETPLESRGPAAPAALSSEPAKPAAAGAGSTRPSAARGATARRLRAMRLERGRWIADLAAASGGPVELRLATRELPLAHRGPVICRRVAELVAPEAVPETTLEVLPLAELLHAAPDPRSRKLLGQTLRVLADGRVRGAAIGIPSSGFAKIDLTDELEGTAIFRWESALVRRETPDESLRKGLSAYQAVLVVDHLVQNHSRKSLLVGEGGSRVVAGEGSDAFTTQPVVGALTSPLTRLARHVTYSASLVERLRELNRERLASVLGTGLGSESLATPKEIDQILERKRGLQKLVDGLVARRGRQKAIALP